MSVTVAGTTVSPLMYYTSAGQVAALLPSNTPTGTGTITVTYNNQTSQPAPITVVQNNIGIFTVTSDGGGAGIVTYSDYSLVSASKAANCGGPYTTCGAANPGDTLTIWATGLGPVSGSDAAGAGLGVNQPNIPLTVWLGGIEAPVIYQGRGCCIGEDQIAFKVPTGVLTGCAVPLAIQINSEVSNTAAIPIANGSRTCTPTNPGFGTAAAVPTLGVTSTTYGNISLQRQDNSPGFQDSVKAQFLRFTVPAADQPFFVTYVDTPPLGTCQVYNSLKPQFSAPLTETGTLNAGTPLSVKGPNGMQTFAGSGGAFSGTLSSNGSYLTAGTYTVSMPGGADVPGFSAGITIPAFPTMTSPPPDAANATSVSRSSGLTVTWTGGSSSAFVVLDGTSATDNTYTTGASFECLAPAGAGSFTIPPSVLLAMPAGNFGGLDFHPAAAPTALGASGLAVGVLSAQWDTYTPLSFK
jgi:uncharacterized protein (TIGR03437 family)